MDLAEFSDRYREIVSALKGRLGSDVCRDLLSYLDTGEEGLAVEFLMGRLIHDRIPVSSAEVATLMDLMQYFELSPDAPEAGDFYSSLTDPHGTAAELTVVDGPAS